MALNFAGLFQIFRQTQLSFKFIFALRLINKIVPSKIKKISTNNIPFKLMENIEMFTKACKDYGLTDAETFQTVDLWDGENMHQVCICIHALGRKVFILF